MGRGGGEIIFWKIVGSCVNMVGCSADVSFLMVIIVNLCKNNCTEMDGIILQQDNSGAHDCGILLFHNPNPSNIRTIPSDEEHWYLLICTRGRFSYRANGIRSDYGRGLLLLPYPMSISELDLGHDFEGQLLVIPYRAIIGMDFAANMNFYSSIREQPYSQVNNAEMRRITKYIELIQSALCEQDSPFAESELMHLCQGLIGNCQKYYRLHDPAIRNNRLEQITNEFIKLVAHNCNKERKMKFYAEKLCITPKYLSSVISTMTGKQASRWIEEFTIMNAKAMLCSTRLSINEISDQMNFLATSDFSKYFRKYTNMSPNEFRKSKQ